MRRYSLRDDQWDRIKDLPPGRDGSVGVTAADNRLFIEAVLYHYWVGIPWRDLPERFGDPPMSIAVSTAGPNPAFGSASSSISRPMPTTNNAMIDNTIVRTHQHSADTQKSRRRPSHRPLARRTEHQDP
jgi:hypothetical protein